MSVNERIEGLKVWARVETVKAIASENVNKENKEAYEDACMTFCNFIDDLYLHENPEFVKSIFCELLNGKTLSPINENEDCWAIVQGFDPVAENDNPGYTIYQNTRRNSLFKKVTYERKTGEVEKVEYSDERRISCIDINTYKIYSGGIGYQIANEMCPIKFPYEPDKENIKVYTDHFKCHENFKGDYDTVGVLYLRNDSDPDVKNMTEIMRFFKVDHVSGELVEINKTEFFARKQKAGR